MTLPRLTVLVGAPTADGDHSLIRSPAVGLYSRQPEAGSVLRGGQSVGRLQILNHIYGLVLPANVGGQVEGLTLDVKTVPVEYGQVLFHLTQRIFVEVGDAAQRPDPVSKAAVAATYPILSPTDGVFYRQPDALAAAYVSVGDRVTRGQTLALVEVMKCFNPIQYGGPDLPPEAEIVEVCAEDGAEIKAKQTLFLVREAAM